jgi:hypothetical protein
VVFAAKEAKNFPRSITSCQLESAMR